jgi:hypothetical protein
MPEKNARHATSNNHRAMYKNTSADTLAAAEWAARIVSKKDRARFDRFFAAIESFARDNDMIVGGLAAVRLLLAIEPPSIVGEVETPPRPRGPDLDAYFLELYSAAPVDDAKALTKKLYELDPDGLGHYAGMLTRVPGKELVISLAGRDLAVVRGLASHKGIRVLDLVLPSVCPGQFVSAAEEPDTTRNKSGVQRPRMLCFGPELSLMSVVAALCDPSRAAEWSPLLATEAKLRSFYLAEHSARTAEFLKKLGGRRNRPKGPSNRAAVKARLVAALVEILAGIDGRADVAEPRVLVGGFSCAPEPMARSEAPGACRAILGRIQLVTPNKMAAEAAAIQTIAARVLAEAGAHGAGIQTLVHNPAIPTDARLRRLTVYLQLGATREPIADIFNAAEYGLVPFVPTRMSLATHGQGGSAGAETQPQEGAHGSELRSPSGIRIRLGTPFAQMRFQLANIWTMRLQAKLGAVAPEFAETVTGAMLRAYRDAGSALDRKLREIADGFAAADPAGPAGLAELFPVSVDRVVGVFEDESIAKKRAAWAAAESSRVRHGPYYPARAARLAAEGKPA